MGYTQFTVSKLEELISKYNPRSVIDLGAQNMYNQPLLPAPYASEWYEQQNILYTCIDLNGENGAVQVDLSKEVTGIWTEYDLVVDAGTSEHVGNEKSEFKWEAIYNCWVTKHAILKNRFPMYSENPKTGNWPFHGRQYYTQDFYTQLAKLTDYVVVDLGEHPACNNTVDGWNIYCTMIKHSDRFPTLEQFKTLPLKQS